MEDKYYEDGVSSGRLQSPGVEHAFQDQISSLIKLMLESKGLYQNVRVNEDFVKKFKDSDKLLAEFSKRPINLFSRGEAETKAYYGGRIGVSALGTPHDEFEAGCYLPNLKLHCHKCKSDSSFLSLNCSAQSRSNDPYPKIGKETEQVFSVTYQCAHCRNAVITFQVLRKGYKFQVTGRTVAFRPKLDKDWPAEITDIVRDAYAAATENDLPAAYYHLRTSIEFYIKTILKIDLDTKSEGNDLCEKYNSTIDDRLKSGFPSFSALYSELSSGLHTRKVTEERFQKIAKDLLSHFKAKILFSEYS